LPTCDLCGEKAGFFQSRHSVCVTQNATIRSRLQEQVFNDVLAGLPYSDVETRARQAVAEGSLLFDLFREPILEGANEAASALARKAPLPLEELTRLVDLLKGFGIDVYSAQWAQRRWFAMAFVGMSHTLWQVLHDVTPFYDSTGRMIFNLHAGEIPIFSAGKVSLAEEQIISSNLGTLSIPLGGGISYAFDPSKGSQASGLLPIDVGEMLITNQSIYFGGQKKSLRISLAQVVRFQPYLDAVGVYDTQGPARVFVPDYSGMDTGWFFLELLTTLASKS